MGGWAFAIGCAFLMLWIGVVIDGYISRIVTPIVEALTGLKLQHEADSQRLLDAIEGLHLTISDRLPEPSNDDLPLDRG